MVRTARQESDNEKLDRIITEVAQQHGYEVFKTGWARITWQVFKRNPQTRDLKMLVTVESFASSSGEIKVMAPEGMLYAEELGKRLEAEFEAVQEAVIIEDYDKTR